VDIVNSKEDADYRLRLAEGFLREAEEDVSLCRWRSCVSNSQLVVENSGKAIIAIFEPLERTHEPAERIKALLEESAFDESLREEIKEVIPLFEELGFEEHFMTDYGDESTQRVPWQIYGEEEAKEAIQIARRCFEISKKVYNFYWGTSHALHHNNLQKKRNYLS
jgi:HEPN domain-containing protein